MAIQFSNFALESMGFTPIAEGQQIVGRFFGLHIYEIQGVVLQEFSLPSNTDAIRDRNYKLAVGSSVNGICQELIGDDFTDDETNWQSELKCKPPYLAVLLGPTQEHAFSGSHIQDRGDFLCTFDGFSKARAELNEWSSSTLPHLLAGLVASFFEPDFRVRFLPVDRAIYGIMPDGKMVRDIRISGSATLSTSRAMTAEIVTRKIELAQEIARNSNPKAVKFFHLATEESDFLKKFLYFFLAIEIEIHRTFGKIDNEQKIKNLLNSPERIAETARSFFKSQSESWKNLSDRFMWCVLCTWPSLSNSDVENFKALKKIRDGIAHGDIEVPTLSSVDSVEKLAIKILQEVVP